MKYIFVLTLLLSQPVWAKKNYDDAFDAYVIQRYNNNITLYGIDDLVHKKSAEYIKSCRIETDSLIAVLTISGDGSLSQIYKHFDIRTVGLSNSDMQEKYRCYLKGMKGEMFGRHDLKVYYIHTILR